MEKTENRVKYISDLPYFVKNLEIKTSFLNKIKSHKYFKIYENSLNEFKGEVLKSFILLELTKERSTCAAMVKLLEDSKQNELSQRLEKFNKSSGPMPLNTEVQIDVVKGAAPILGRSNTYTLYRHPRGKCIIINNVENQQTPDVYDKSGNHLFSPKGLKRETIRFEHIFTQLHFDVKIINNLSEKQMSEQLKELSKEKSLSNDEAFVLIVISHGQDKKVLGYNACEAMRRINCNLIRKEDRVEAEQEMVRDSVPIKDLVKIFADENCPQLSSKPKLFFFICCRNKDDNKPVLNKDGESYQDTPMTPSEFKEPTFKDGKQVAVKNLDTFVSYSCADGCESNYNSEWGMSYFGVALTQSIAQYSCEEPLSVIMNRTSIRLKKMFEDMKEEQQKAKSDGDVTDSDLNIGSFAIQVNTYAMDRQLYFNPGFDDRK